MTRFSSVATTRLDHIAANLTAIRAHVGGRKILAAVKADAYGHGAVEVSRLIEQEQLADWLAVATVAEGQELRTAGITLPILKLTLTHADELAEALAADLALCVMNEQTITEVAAAARAAGVEAEVHLKVDTGLHRIGAPPEAAAALAQLIDAERLRLGGLMSHLAESDEADGVEFTASQTRRFAEVVAAVEAARGPVPLKHLANSGAILWHPETWFDMVRPGISIYGASPNPDLPQTVPLLPGLEWHSRVVLVKPVHAGETVGYGRTWQAPSDTWLATINIGYGDGYSRLLSNRGRMLINGRPYPVVSRVSMDQTLVDVGPDPVVKVGDEVTLIGRDGQEEITTTQIANLMGTIPYEVTCLITGRVGREYRR